MSKDKRVYESDDERPVPHPEVKNEECGTGVEQLSTTKRLMRKANENKVLITLWLAIALFIGREVWAARDDSLKQPLVDQMQDFRIEQHEQRLANMDEKLDAILERLPPK